MPNYTPIDPRTMGCFSIDPANLWGCYFNITVAQGSGTSYLSCSTDGSIVDLFGEDDDSGRQRWEILPNGVTSSSGLILCYIRVLCGVTGDRQYFGVDTDPDPGFPDGRIQLVKHSLAANFVIYLDSAPPAKFAIGWHEPPGTQLYVCQGSNSNQVGLSPTPSVLPWMIAKVQR